MRRGFLSVTFLLGLGWSLTANASDELRPRIDALLKDYEAGSLNRDDLINSLAALKLEHAGRDLQAVTIDHVTIRVPDVARASAFYQDILDAPLLRVYSDTHYLGVNHSFFAIQPSDSKPAWIDHFCLGLKNFEPSQIAARLKAKGIAVEGGEPGSDTLRFVDPDGLHIQLCATDYAYRQTH